MRKFLVRTVQVLILVALIAGGLYAWWWNADLRWRPATISQNQKEIQQLLDRASYVSPGGSGQAIYMVSYRGCAECIRYETQEFPKLRAAGVDTRVIVFARPDLEGQSQSTREERSTVAELWVRRDWGLYERWTGAPQEQWRAEGLPVADDNLVGGAVIEAGRKFVADLKPLLSENEVQMRYPVLLWRDRNGKLKACGCSDARSWRAVRQDFGAPDRAPAAPPQPPPQPQPQPAPQPLPPAAPQPAPEPAPDLATPPTTEPAPAPTPGQPVTPPAGAPTTPSTSTPAARI